MNFATLGFLTVGVFLALILLTRTPVLVALLLVPVLPAALPFMLPFAIALPVNRTSLSSQQEQLSRHAPSVVMVATIMFAAGILTGILKGTGMLEAMAKALATAIPDTMALWLSTLVAVSSMPLSLSGVSLQEHQLYTFKWASGTTLVKSAVAWLTGAL